MAQIFPEWTNQIPVYLAIWGLAFALLAALGVWYYFSPEFTDVGYRPRQPVPFSHKLHVGELHIDCRYCHVSVEISAVASVPSTQSCMNCHQLVASRSEKLRLVRESLETGYPIQWIRVHNVPDYAYFNHSLHISAAIGCVSCHGDVAQMDEIMQVEPLSMNWCLDCHRDPDPHLRPADQITNASWSPLQNQPLTDERIEKDSVIGPSTDCSSCHR